MDRAGRGVLCRTLLGINSRESENILSVYLASRQLLEPGTARIQDTHYTASSANSRDTQI